MRACPSAEVIKIEHPTRGDDTRAWGPPYAKHIRGDKQDGPGESAYFLSVGENSTGLSLLSFSTFSLMVKGQSEQKVSRSVIRASFRGRDPPQACQGL